MESVAAGRKGKTEFVVGLVEIEGRNLLVFVVSKQPETSHLLVVLQVKWVLLIVVESQEILLRLGIPLGWRR